jgi:5-methylthioadenosine/S-adenosylhomocysteine deaminase
VADLIIANGYVVTMDSRRQIYSDGAVAVEGRNIVGVGRTKDVLARHKAAHVIDAAGKLVIPGLVDGHNHAFQYLSKGIGDDVDIMTWLYKRVYPYETHVNAEEAYVGALGNYVQMIKTGTTCFNEPGGYHTDSLAQAATDVGIRGILNRSTRDIADQGAPLPEKLFENLETNLRQGEAAVAKWNNAAEGRLRCWFSLRYVFNVSDELCKAIKALADQYKVGIHAHAAAVEGENEAIEERFGKRSLERFHDLGLFGPNLYLVHMGYPNEREIGWLKEHDVKIAHCPSASMHGAYGVVGNQMMKRMIDLGLTISLGTDSATAGRFLDMVRVMYLAACAHRDQFADATIMGAYKAMEMATIDGARACLWDDQIGSLQAGKRADIVIVAMDELRWHPNLDPVRSLVYAADGDDVETVVIDGRVVMRDRVILTVDEEKVKRDVIRAGKAWIERADMRLDIPWPVR